MLLKQLFSRRVGYAAHVLCLMAQLPPLTTVPVADLARKMICTWPGTSATYLSKVAQALVEAGILASVRGSSGGYCLAPRASAVSLLDVVSALEGAIDERCPLTPNGPCALRTSCQNYSVLLNLQNDFFKLLSQVTIQQLASNLLPPLKTVKAAVNCAYLSVPSLTDRQITGSELCPTFPSSHLKFGSATSPTVGNAP